MMKNQEAKLKISTDMIKDLREKSGAGVMECRNALEDAEGNLDKALGALKELVVLGVRPGPSPLDVVDAQLVELLCDPDLVGGDERDILRLGAVPERRVIYLDEPHS